MKKPSYTITCRRRLYFWYRYVQLLMWFRFRPDDAGGLYEYIVHELENDTDRYLKITIKED